MVINVSALARRHYLEVTRHPKNAAVPWHITAGMQVDFTHMHLFDLMPKQLVVSTNLWGRFEFRGGNRLG